MILRTDLAQISVVLLHATKLLRLPLAQGSLSVFCSFNKSKDLDYVSPKKSRKPPRLNHHNRRCSVKGQTLKKRKYGTVVTPKHSAISGCSSAST